MFSRYKKDGPATPVKPAAKSAPEAKPAAAAAATAPEALTPASLRKPLVLVAGDPVAADKERKRKERMGEI